MLRATLEPKQFAKLRSRTAHGHRPVSGELAAVTLLSLSD